MLYDSRASTARMAIGAVISLGSGGDLSNEYLVSEEGIKRE